MNLCAAVSYEGSSTFHSVQYTLGLFRFQSKLPGIAEGSQSQEGKKNIKQ